MYNTHVEGVTIRADIVTMPPAVFDKMYNHVLTDKGLYLFDMDWAKVKR